MFSALTKAQWLCEEAKEKAVTDDEGEKEMNRCVMRVAKRLNNGLGVRKVLNKMKLKESDENYPTMASAIHFFSFFQSPLQIVAGALQLGAKSLLLN